MVDHIAELAFYVTNNRASVNILLSQTWEQFKGGLAFAQITKDGVLLRPGHRPLNTNERGKYPAWRVTLTQSSAGWAAVPREPFAQVPVDVVQQPGGSLLLVWPELHRCVPPRRRLPAQAGTDTATADWLVNEVTGGDPERYRLALEWADDLIAALKLLKGRKS